MGFGAWDIAGCDCGCVSACSQTFTVQGCNGLAYAGVTVQVYDPTGVTLLTSGTTNVSGQVTLTWAGTGSVVVKVAGASARFAAFSSSMSLLCGGSTTLALTPDAGFICYHTCLLPLPTTLNGSLTGTVTATYTGTWQTSGTWANTWKFSSGLTSYFVTIDRFGFCSVWFVGNGSPCFMHNPETTLACPLSFNAFWSWTGAQANCNWFGGTFTATE